MDLSRITSKHRLIKADGRTKWVYSTYAIFIYSAMLARYSDAAPGLVLLSAACYSSKENMDTYLIHYFAFRYGSGPDPSS